MRHNRLSTENRYFLLSHLLCDLVLMCPGAPGFSNTKDAVDVVYLLGRGLVPCDSARG